MLVSETNHTNTFELPYIIIGNRYYNLKDQISKRLNSDGVLTCKISFDDDKQVMICTPVNDIAVQTAEISRQDDQLLRDNQQQQEDDQDKAPVETKQNEATVEIEYEKEAPLTDQTTADDSKANDVHIIQPSTPNNLPQTNTSAIGMPQATPFVSLLLTKMGDNNAAVGNGSSIQRPPQQPVQTPTISQPLHLQQNNQQNLIFNRQGMSNSIHHQYPANLQPLRLQQHPAAQRPQQTQQQSSRLNLFNSQGMSNSIHHQYSVNLQPLQLQQHPAAQQPQQSQQSDKPTEKPTFNISLIADKIRNKNLVKFLQQAKVDVEFASKLKKELEGSTLTQYSQTQTENKELDHKNSTFNKIQFFRIGTNLLRNIDGTTSTEKQVPSWVNEHRLYKLIHAFKSFAVDVTETGVVYFVFTRIGLSYIGQSTNSTRSRFTAFNERYKTYFENDFCHIKLMELVKQSIWQVVSDFALGLLNPNDIFITAIRVTTKTGLYSKRLESTSLNNEELKNYLDKDKQSGSMDEKEKKKKGLDLVERLFIGACTHQNIPLLNVDNCTDKVKISDKNCLPILEHIQDA